MRAVPPAQGVPRATGEVSPRHVLRRALEGHAFQRTVLTLIVLNALLLGVEASLPETHPARAVLGPLGDLLLGLFACEMLLKIAVQGRAFFRSAWNVFDLAVVAVSLLPVLPDLAVLRALRILQALRLISTAPGMRMVIDGTLGASTGLAACLAIVLLVYYIYAILCVNLFGALDPAHFGSLWTATVSLYAVMASYGIDRSAIRDVADTQPWAWWVFGSFVLITSFAVLNLIVGVFSAAVYEQYETARRLLRKRATEGDGEDTAERLLAMQAAMQADINRLSEHIRMLELLLLEARRDRVADDADDD